MKLNGINIDHTGKAMFNLIKKVINRYNTKAAEGEELFLQGIKSASANQHDKAIELFTRSIAVLDIYPAPFINRGASYQYQERYLDAWDDYAHALQMEITSPSPSVKMHLSALNQNMNAIAPLMVINKENGDAIRNKLVTDGIENFTKRWAEELTKKLHNDKELVRYFCLEEMKELHDLGGDHRSFVLSIGFQSSEYLNIKDNPNTAEAFFLMKSVLCCFSREPKKMLLVRTKILTNISSSLINNNKYKIDSQMDQSLGIRNYKHLKKIIEDQEILEMLILSANGMNQYPITMASKVTEAVRLTNYISNLIGISGLQLLNAISGKQCDKKIFNMIEEAERQKELEYAGDDNEWFNELIFWAEKYKLPKLQPFDSLVYRQTGFPRNKSELIELEYLHLPSCNISKLPSSIGKLKNLQAICLNDNQVTEIPSEICKISGLIRLDLDDNLISNLPKEIGELRELQTLSLSGNPIEDFPIEMKNLLNLNNLDIRQLKVHLGSKYSPLSSDGFEVYKYFENIIKEDNPYNFEKTIRKKEIREISEKLKITYLVHFTNAKNLDSIIKNGIYPLDRLDELNKEDDNVIYRNDKLRLDGHKDATSISIGHPNSKMFYKYRMENQEQEWVVLVLQQSILWDKDCAFCKHNAADAKISSQPIEALKTSQSLLELFDEIQEATSRTEQNLKSFDPTDVQAEILVFDLIEPQLIAGVVFNSSATKEKFIDVIGDRKTWIHADSKGLFASRSYARRSS